VPPLLQRFGQLKLYELGLCSFFYDARTGKLDPGPERLLHGLTRPSVCCSTEAVVMINGCAQLRSIKITLCRIIAMLCAAVT
jgi:hypothetical protein